jgi:hypothetical protein
LRHDGFDMLVVNLDALRTVGRRFGFRGPSNVARLLRR